MATKAKKLTEAQLRAQLAKGVVDPLFRKAWKPPASSAIPGVVLENRRKRAQSRILEALVSRGSVVVPREIVKETAGLVGMWESVLFDDAFSGVEKYEIERAKERELALAMESQDPLQVRDVVEKEYRRKVIEQYGRIELRGLGTSHRILLEMDRVFVPLHLELRPKEGADWTEMLGRRVSIVDALEASKRLLITGGAGSGKSTLVGWLATGAAGQRDLPLVVPVRSQTAGGVTFESIGKTVGLPAAHVREACRDGRAVLFIDGLDEAAPGSLTDVRASMEKMAANCPQLRIVATTRPGASGSLAGFVDYSLPDLTSGEVEEFVDKWCLAAEESAPRNGSPREESRLAAVDLKKRIQRTPAVQRLAVSPLMITILCVVHRFLGKSIPEHRVTLYDKCTDVLLYEWDRAKFPEGSTVGKLDAPAKRTLLMGLARKMHDASQAELAESQVVLHFKAVLPSLGAAGIDAKAMLAEIRDRSGLLVEKRPGFFGFSHLTFQEYLTALAYGKAWKALPGKYKDPWWHEVIALAAGVPGVDAGALIRVLLGNKDQLGLVLAARCLETATVVPMAVREKVEHRLRELLPPRNENAVEQLARMGVTAAPLLMECLQGKLNEQEMLHTMDALGSSGYGPAIPMMIGLLKSKSWRIAAKAAVILAIYSMSNESAARALESFFKQDARQVLAPELLDMIKALVQVSQRRERVPRVG